MAFLLTRDRRRRSKRSEATTSRQLLDYLRGAGRILAAGPARRDHSPLRALHRRRVRPQLGHAAKLLARCPGFLAHRFDRQPVELESLTAHDANQFVLHEAGRFSPSRCKLVVTALRSFLRHLHKRGDLPADPAPGLAPVRNWWLSGLPKALGRVPHSTSGSKPEQWLRRE